MATHYPEKADMATRAVQTWPILAMVAHQRATITYGQLAAILGIHPRPIYLALDYIMHYCKRHDLPPLTAVIVSAGSGKPGPGLTTAPDQDAALAAIYAVNWWRVVPPTIEELRAAKQAGSRGAGIGEGQQ